MKQRRIYQQILGDLSHKMVFLSGPRQVGKTTLAESIMEKAEPSSYYNWDSRNDRKTLQNQTMDSTSRIWVFDELHKYNKWRNWLKGVYDLNKKKHQIFVTGSAKLNVFNKGGDSLQGRYFSHRLHPFTLSEALNIKTEDYLKSIIDPEQKVDNKNSQSLLIQLLKLGGFPEPFTSGSESYSRRWRNSYGERIIEQEIRDLEQIKLIDDLELLYDRLGEVVGNLLSINNISKDLELAHQTVSRWIKIFERLYVSFQVPPFGTPKIRAVKKEQKLYLWDWPRVSLEGSVLENLVAMHLVRFSHWLNDVEGIKTEVRYIKDVDGHEIDFILLKNREPWIAIEVKSSSQGLDPNMKYFLERIRVPFAYQIHLKGKEDYNVPTINGCKIRILPISTFLQNIP